MARVEGVEVKVGDWVGFKSDIEQCGKIIAINGNQLTLKSGSNGFEGGYICGCDTTIQSADRCWLD